MPRRIGERDLVTVSSLLSLGALSFQIGAVFAQAELVLLPILVLAIATVMLVSATVALAAGYPRGAYRYLLVGAGLLLFGAIISGLPLGVLIAIASALAWAAVIKLNLNLRRGWYDRK